MNHTLLPMFLAMILSGILSTMNIWTNNMNDIRFSMNDAYMILLMTGWMFLFMGIFNKDLKSFSIGLILVIANLVGIRKQLFVTPSQYKLGMIPHHSMAIHMSKKLLERNPSPELAEFARNIIKTQDAEISFMKST